ncbi:hypothetical protein [Stackebrandtia soli]|uniref:hypothetical protein n=1 Tax=Stackebrandtia soli TaxID=1892856 RepID=UPI0039E97883
MGISITSLGDRIAHEHEGYVGAYLRDGSLTGSSSREIDAAKTGKLTAACACDWRSDRTWDNDANTAGGWPSDALEDEILTDWYDHVYAVADGERDRHIGHLTMMMARIGRQYGRGSLDLDNLDDLERDLASALDRVKQIRRPSDF